MVQKPSSSNSKAEIIRCNYLEKSINDQRIIKGISFSIYSNCLNWIVGKNGCGKSTLVKILAGLLEQDSGELTYASKEIAVLLEYDCLDTRMSGLDNIYFFMELQEQKEFSSKLKYYATILDIFDDLERSVAEYSKGMKRKLSILIILLCNAEIIILDEPFSGLDNNIRERLIQELYNEDRWIVVVDHELRSFNKRDNVIIMDNGKVVENNCVEYKEDLLSSGT